MRSSIWCAGAVFSWVWGWFIVATCCVLSAQAATITATYNTAADVPVTSNDTTADERRGHETPRAATKTEDQAAPQTLEAAVSAIELAGRIETAARINGRSITAAKTDGGDHDQLTAGVQAILRGSNSDDDSQTAGKLADKETLDAGVHMALSQFSFAAASGQRF